MSLHVGTLCLTGNFLNFIFATIPLASGEFRSHSLDKHGVPVYSKSNRDHSIGVHRESNPDERKSPTRHNDPQVDFSIQKGFFVSRLELHNETPRKNVCRFRWLRT